MPDWGGTLYSVDTQSGKPNWQAKLSDYTGNANSVTRNTPAISGKSIIVGDQASGTVMAIDKKTGKLLWSSVAESNPQARITSSPVIYGNRIYARVPGVTQDAQRGQVTFSRPLFYRGLRDRPIESFCLSQPAQIVMHHQYLCE